MFTKEQNDILFKLSQEVVQLRKENEEQSKRTKKAFEATEAQVQKTSDRIDKAFKIYGNASNNQGDVAEEFYYNSLEKTMTLNGIKFDFISRNLNKSHNKLTDEYDIVMANGKDVFIIEVKYKAHENDLDTLLNKKYPNFKKLYPEYKKYQHHLGLATFHINDDLKTKALNNHVSVLQRSGNVIETTAAA